MSFTIHVEGLDDVAHMLTGLESPQLDKITRKGTGAAAAVYVTAMRAAIPVGNHPPHKTKGGVRQPGALKKSVRFRAIHRRTGVGHVVGPMGRWASMRHLYALGHRVKRTRNGPVVGHAGPHPFMDSAMSQEAAAFAAAERAMFAAIDKL